MLTTPAPNVTRAQARKKLVNPTSIVVAVSVVVVVLWSTVIEWEWSFIDDPGQKIWLEGDIRRSGLLGGVLNHIQAQAISDWNVWGLFRPSYYVYTSIFYLTSPAVAHGLRLAMFLAVIVIPVMQLSRRNGNGRDVALAIWGACLLLANTTLYQGLTFLSLQELTGLALVALGLATRPALARSTLWLAAAWMKTPFVWLLLAWGVYLLLTRRLKTGAAVTAVGLATVVAAAVSAGNGTYTTNFVLSLDKIESSLRAAVPLFYWPGLIGVLGMIALGPRLKTIRWRDPLALMLAAGGALYFANLLPWGSVDVYYASPAIWMVSAAAIRLFATAEPRGWNAPWRPATAVLLAITLAATAYLVTKIVRLQLERNAAIVNLRDFALTLTKPKPVIGINGPEAAERLQQIIVLNRPDWGGTVVYVDPADPTAQPDYYVKIADQIGINPRLAQNPIRTWPAATVYDP